MFADVRSSTLVCQRAVMGRAAPLSLTLFLLMIALPSSLEQDEDIPHNEVKNWALKFGVDLWEFGRQFTKMSEIQRKYHEHEVKVVRKDGLILIREMAAEVKNMMDMKMNAVLRIMDSAEQAALSHKLDESLRARYLNSHYLNGGSDGPNYITLTTNKHFDHNPVNTNYSSVLLPSGVDEADSQVQNGIKWSDHLDPLFVNNYEMDPSLSWQYFGSSAGFLRRYPAIQWPPIDGMASVSQVYDFRSSEWYLGAATSPKDIVILLDTSSSMSTKARNAGRAVVNAVLDTLSNNDFISVLRFAEITEEIVPCFQNALVQATSYNIRELRLALDNVVQGGTANFTGAFATGFELLQRYNRSGQGCQCNQAIFLITNGPPSAFPEVFRLYNFPHHPVRVFTFLVGKDGSNANDMEEMACSNKGYYTRVITGGDAVRAVRHYSEVMAQPLIMYQHDHPVHWTPVYAGGRANTLKGSQHVDDQLMTSVSTPVFDRRNYSTRTAKLLGVVGTDVPVLQIQKLVPQYRVGVNGYSFIVDNNGHLLYHPDLRPLFQETLRPTYSSVDLTEVELVDPEHGYPMENNTVLLDLRHELIDQKEGETELGVIIHYDQMKRVMNRRHRYFYNAIDGTPFSLGLVVPEGYGMYEVRGTLEIKHSDVNVLEYFKGINWRIHPDWVYCEYNYASEHWFESAEEQLLHFLERTHKPGWKWMSLRPRSPVKDTGHTMKKMDKDSYYCDKELMQSLVFDAMVTDHLERHSGSASDGNRQQGYQMFGVQRSFIATRSGLLRWQDHGLEASDPNAQNFFEGNRRALDEVWYKRAVHQHTIEPESFVFSVPFDADKYGRPLVTATHAVFIEHKGHRAPAAVVGLQFLHSSLASHFVNITSACTGGTECRRNCAAKELDCYILDNNGFIILSENNDHTGKFFGQVDGTIMDSLVQDRIYKKIPVDDYQGACFDDRASYHGSAPAKNFQPLRLLWHWILHLTLWITAEAQLWGPAFTGPSDDIDYNDYGSENVPYGAFSGPDGPLEEVRFPSNTNAPPAPKYKHTPGNGSVPRPCRQVAQLYNLQPDRLNNSGIFNPLKGKLTNCHSSGCERPFSVQKIPHSNLILLVVDTLCPCGTKQLSVAPQEVVESSCRRKPQEHMYRRKPTKCINYHPEEIEIKECSRGWHHRGYASLIVLLTATSLVSS